MGKVIEMRKRPVVVSKHGAKRMRKRLGVSKKSVDKLAKEAMLSGQRREEFSGSLRRYLDKIWYDSDKKADVLIHGEFLFIFVNSVLVTAWNIPTRYRNTLKG